jgi:hypothetical protein
MIKNILLLFIVFFFGLNSCIIGVIDSIERFCIAKNLSKRKISVYFSNSVMLNISDLSPQFHDSNLAITSNSYKEIFSQGNLLMKEAYQDSTKKLYAFFLDQDSIDKYFKVPLNKTVIDKSFLQRQLVDIRNIKETDTLFFIEKK